MSDCDTFRPKTLLNQFLSDSKATLKQSIKRFFDSENGQGDPADGQNLSKHNKNTDILAKNTILGAESSKILKVQNWCQNGLKAIIEGVISKSRKIRF